MSFELHDQLAADTITLGTLPLSLALLMNDERFPWIILVPRVDAARDLIDLGYDDQRQLLGEIGTASRALREHFSPDKLNVATLGNMVPQLHVHVIARQTSDAAWPAPVWGVGTPEPYEKPRADKLAATLAATLGISA